MLAQLTDIFLKMDCDSNDNGNESPSVRSSLDSVAMPPPPPTASFGSPVAEQTVFPGSQAVGGKHRRSKPSIPATAMESATNATGVGVASSSNATGLFSSDAADRGYGDGNEKGMHSMSSMRTIDREGCASQPRSRDEGNGSAACPNGAKSFVFHHPFTTNEPMTTAELQREVGSSVQTRGEDSAASAPVSNSPHSGFADGSYQHTQSSDGATSRGFRCQGTLLQQQLRQQQQRERERERERQQTLGETLLVRTKGGGSITIRRKK